MRQQYSHKKVSLFTIATIIMAIFLIISPAPSRAAVKSQHNHPITIPLSFDYYYTYEMVNQAVKKLHQAYPELTKLDLVGKSEENREIYCLTIHNPKTGNSLEKPGIWIDANIHGNEIQGGEVALYLANYLLENYKKNTEITDLIDKKCFYIIPVINVDGRYHFFEDGGTDSSNRSIRRAQDDDHDGLFDEDFPDDLDGDGNICKMRIKDPNGEYKTDPDDPRLMIRVKPGEKGEWTLLGDEGIDNDEDGKINEDSEGYLDPNRNWGYDWMPPYVQSGAGQYPFSGVGLKAVAEYIQKRPNISMAWTFHNCGGMYLRGPSNKAQAEYPPQDVSVYDFLGKQSERISPGYRYLLSWKDLYSTFGDSGEWMSMLNGCYTFVGELFPSNFETFKTYSESNELKQNQQKNSEEGHNFFRNNPEIDKERLKFNDHLTQGELFKPWTPFKHPTYGDIEIGGWVKFSTRLPAPFMIKDMVHRNAAVVIFSAKHTPDVSMKLLETKKIGKDLYRLRVSLANTSALPTMTYQAQQNRLYTKDILKATGKNIKVIAGGEIKNIYNDSVTYKEHRPEIQFLVVPGFGKVDYEFIISGKGDVTLDYHSRHAGKIIKTIHLN